jgi:hypothetical protein
MGKYATGKYAKAISDRSGMEFPYKEMVKEWNGSLVHFSEFEPKQPQLEPKPNGADAISLLNVRTDRTETAVPKMLPLNPFTTTSGSTTITVKEPDHGRSTGDTVRFRDAQNVGGVLGSTINLAIGYTITKVNDDKYTFATATTSSITETGGGGSASAGPVTVQS